VTNVADPEFPSERLQRIDTDQAQIDQLQDEFTNSDLVVRQSLAQSWASMSDGMLREHVHELEQAGHFEPAEAEAAESALQDPAGEPGHEDTASTG
jgi:hypothetical protein